jgi:maltose alpha-D-glucosyltransferase/alpha-amylase
MTQKDTYVLLKQIFQELYPNESLDTLNSFVKELEELQAGIPNDGNPDWYKDAIVYNLYVDLFNKDFTGLIEKLDHLSELGVSCLWLLPILDSPMKDAGFDIRDYRKIRSDLFSLPDTSSPEDYQKNLERF